MDRQFTEQGYRKKEVNKYFTLGINMQVLQSSRRKITRAEFNLNMVSLYMMTYGIYVKPVKHEFFPTTGLHLTPSTSIKKGAQVQKWSAGNRKLVAQCEIKAERVNAIKRIVEVD